MVYVLVPSYNDSANLEPLLKNLSTSLKEKRFQVLIVNDGSTDNTEEAFKELSQKFPLIGLGYKKNRGPGYAFWFGFGKLIPQLKSGDVVVTMEADNTSDLTVFPKMIEMAANYDVVLASPHAAGGKLVAVPFLRALISRVASLVDSLVFGIRGVKTYSSFFRVYSGDILKKLIAAYGEKFMTEKGFSGVVELLVKLDRIGARIAEVPATVDWSKRRGASKMKVKKALADRVVTYTHYLRGDFNPNLR